jgi:probable O-glycosylation ligase (exosortase A-associated)
MRDIFVTVVIFGALPFVLARPYIGILLWTWVSFMNPHRLCWGFAYDFPFAMIVALVTLVSVLISRERKKIPWTRETVILLIFISWMVITTIFSVYPILAWPQLDKVLKIQLMVFVTMMVMQSKERLNLLVWVLALSLAFYGVKGGIFTIMHGGVYHVRGPNGTFIGGDNEMGLALIMTIPLLRYLQLTATRVSLRYVMTAAMVLCALAAIGSQSRGAMLGIAAMGMFLWLKGRNKLFTGLLTAIAAALILMTMPQQWFDRMATIETYQHDQSATGRINAWEMAFNLAKDRPLGGGFNAFQRGMFAIYAPDPTNVHDSHSIYFEVLGEHGFFGLALFLILGLMTWRTSSWIIKRARGDPEDRWAGDLAAMVQVSLVGYASGGAFLGLANFDLYYTLIAVVVLCKTVLVSQRTTREVEPAKMAAHPRRAGRGPEPQAGLGNAAPDRP